ncbi:plasmid recombination protein [Salipiger manganoxidans]|uniref:plasmid recombination protein n=1 Tax=Salipiger marinus TaxID=555512 RepID=UPI001E57E92A|nr:plasmid recombination protein [Salipiger manganoxidans]MCD1620943.1 plasmid recombination protein [Salipiger manganoxidans]
MPANTEIAKPVPSSGGQASPAYPIVLRFKGMAPDLMHRFVLHDGRSGGDLSHVDLAVTQENRVLHGRPDWHVKVKQRIQVLRHANHREEIRAQLAKHRIKAAKQIRLEGPSDPWRPSREGPMREGILTAHKSFFGGVGRAEWDKTKVEAFRQCALEFLKEHFPDDQLLYVVAHADEEAYHLHFVVAVWYEKHSANRGRQMLLQPSANPLLANYEHAQDLAGMAFTDLGICRGERRAAARREARRKQEDVPPPRRHVPPSEWRTEQIVKGRSTANRLIAEASAVAEAVTAYARPDAEKMVRKCRKRAMKDARRRNAAARKAERAMQQQLAEVQGALAEKRSEVAVRQAQVDKLVQALENVNTKALQAIAEKKAEFDSLRTRVREMKQEVVQLSGQAEAGRTQVTELRAQVQTEGARVDEAKARYQALALGLQLFERRQIRWEPLRADEPRQLVWAPDGRKPTPLPKVVDESLAPAKSLLELIIELICQILEALFAVREQAVVDDAAVVQQARVELGLEPDMTIEDILKRRAVEKGPTL